MQDNASKAYLARVEKSFRRDYDGELPAPWLCRVPTLAAFGITAMLTIMRRRAFSQLLQWILWPEQSRKPVTAKV